jgi:hypothetical protein
VVNTSPLLSARLTKKDVSEIDDANHGPITALPPKLTNVAQVSW